MDVVELFTSNKEQVRGNEVKTNVLNLNSEFDRDFYFDPLHVIRTMNLICVSLALISYGSSCYFPFISFIFFSFLLHTVRYCCVAGIPNDTRTRKRKPLWIKKNVEDKWKKKWLRRNEHCALKRTRHNDVKYVILMRAFKCTVVRREARFMECRDLWVNALVGGKNVSSFFCQINNRSKRAC